MNKIYRRKLLKMAIATPLLFSVALVLDIDPSLSFLGPLMVFNIIWLFPDPIGLKQIIVLKTLSVIVLTAFVASFMAGLWGINSISLFLFVLLTGWVIQTWMPSAISFGLLPLGVYLGTSTLNSSAPYTTAVYLSLLVAISLGLGWLIERLFWPIFDQEGIEGQVSQTFQIFQDFSNQAFQCRDVDDGSLEALNARAKRSIRALNKALKIGVMTSSLSLSEQDIWIEEIALQKRLLAHLLTISRLLPENRENPLLQELAPELSALGDSLSATFAELSMTIVAKQSGIQLPNPNIEFQQWQTRLTSMRRKGITQSYDLANRLAVGLIEHRLEGLMTDTSKILSWLKKEDFAVSTDLPRELETTQS